MSKSLKIHGYLWRDNAQGNTYHKISIDIDNEQVFASRDMAYGGGTMYLETAKEALTTIGVLSTDNKVTVLTSDSIDGYALSHVSVSVNRKSDLADFSNSIFNK